MHMPEGIGFPIGENGKEYYLMETHLDNPLSAAGIFFETGFEVFHTANLR